MFLGIKKVLFLFFTITSLNGMSQPKDFHLATGSGRADIEKKIMLAAKKISSLQCKFEQEKSSVLLTEKAVSKGVLFYKAPSSLRWEYTEPNKYVSIFHKENVYLKDEKGVVANANKMLKQLGNLIISTINGKSLVENGNFQIDYFENEKNKSTIWVKLTPIQKRLKEMYASIQIKMSTLDYLASEIIMEEKSGDKMKIVFSEKKLNEPISADLFSID